MLKRIPHGHREALLKLLKDVRTESGLIQTDLARRLGRPQNFVSLYERGVRRLDVLELREVCKALGISLGTFIKRLELRL
jgi:transcriptional regulator with XRE-family HTH domain